LLRNFANGSRAKIHFPYIPFSFCPPVFGLPAFFELWQGKQAEKFLGASNGGQIIILYIIEII